jgi:hypothetical protein
MRGMEWLADRTIYPYVLCGALGVLLGEYAFENSIGPRFMHEFGLGALVEYGDYLRLGIDAVCAILITNIYHIGIRKQED